MKKFHAMLCLLFASVKVYALPVGNPLDASLTTEGIWFHPCNGCADIPWYLMLCPRLKLGFYGDYVFNNHMRVDRVNNHASITDTEIYTNAGYIAVNFFNRIDLFGTVGASSVHIEARSKTFGGTSTNINLEVDTRSAISWSLGGKATLLQWRCFGLGAELQYFYATPSINTVSQESLDPLYFGTDALLKYREWQFGLGAAYRIIIATHAELVPYLAARWGKTHIDMQDRRVPPVFGASASTLFNLKNERDWGFVFGTTLVGCHRISVTLEWRFANENAIFVNSQVRF